MEHVHVLVVGAGISGIGTGCTLKREHPERSFVILEGRDALGGTWDLFRYPGIRSDSDMYTFGYAFRPWRSSRDIASGDAILAYLRETVAEYGLEPHIRYGHRVLRLSWSSSEGRWTATVRRDDAEIELTADFLVTGTGYYDYERGHEPEIPGLDAFAGPVVHPQRWPEDLEYTGKRVLVVGSGATAVTLVPALAEAAAHVTMLQRSPTYVASRPAVDRLARILKLWLPERLAHRLIRAKNIAWSRFAYRLARWRPDLVRRTLLERARELTGGEIDVDVHFAPAYDPWDQRVCLVPDDDLFEVLRTERATIVTDTIERFDEGGVVLTSGGRIDADIVVTATGLRMLFLGGIAMDVDGRPVEASELVTYKGVMFGGVPNWVAMIGYTSASWTLKVDLAAQYLCRLLSHMDRYGHEVVVPEPAETGPTRPYMANLTSGYVLRHQAEMPRQGSVDPWLNHDDYYADRRTLLREPIDDGALRFYVS